MLTTFLCAAIALAQRNTVQHARVQLHSKTPEFHKLRMGRLSTDELHRLIGSYHGNISHAMTSKVVLNCGHMVEPGTASMLLFGWILLQPRENQFIVYGENNSAGFANPVHPPANLIIRLDPAITTGRYLVVVNGNASIGGQMWVNTTSQRGQSQNVPSGPMSVSAVLDAAKQENGLWVEPPEGCDLQMGNVEIFSLDD